MDCKADDTTKESSSLKDVPASAQLTLMNWTKLSKFIYRKLHAFYKSFTEVCQNAPDKFEELSWNPSVLAVHTTQHRPTMLLGSSEWEYSNIRLCFFAVFFFLYVASQTVCWLCRNLTKQKISKPRDHSLAQPCSYRKTTGIWNSYVNLSVLQLLKTTKWDGYVVQKFAY